MNVFFSPLILENSVDFQFGAKRRRSQTEINLKLILFLHVSVYLYI